MISLFRANKKLLVITYYWPPSGGPAVQRWLSLTDELAKLGWQIWVLTVDEKYATYQVEDALLLQKVNPAVQVFKTKTIEPFGLYKLLFGKKSIPAPGFSNESNLSLVKKISRFIRGNLFIPDPRKYWKTFAVKKASELIDANQITTIITAGPPHSTHFIGKSLKEKKGIKWLCDFHDLWTDVIYYDLLYHLPFIKKIDRNKEADILISCTGVLTAGEKYKEKLASKSAEIDMAKIHVTRIGYDASLFTKPVAITDKRLTISYVGGIAEYYEPEIFFRSVAAARKALPIDICIRFAGFTAPVVKAFIHQYHLQDVYEETGYVTHAKAVEYMRSSSILLLVNPVTRDEAMVIPGKLYEYLAAGKPIINITRKDAETAAIIEQCSAGKTFERNEEQALTEYLIALFSEWQQTGQLSHQGNKELIETFAISAIAANVSRLLSGLQKG